MPVGYRLYVGYTYAARSAAVQRFDDYLARLTLSRSGRAWGEGVTVRPPDGAPHEALKNGSVHPSLVAEPNGSDSPVRLGDVYFTQARDCAYP
jgi:hypothetical protein